LESTISALFASAAQGDPPASDRLFQAFYAELHRLAKRELWRNGGVGTLGATTLVHEAYIDMSSRAPLSFPDRARFMGYAARAMRGLIIDYARNRHAQKRGGGFEITSLDTEIADNAADHVEISRIGDALDELARVDAPLAQLVDLRFFCGFSFAEIAALRGMSERTVQRDWEKARIYLHGTLRDDLPPV
jgi:RNA polymerase sigma factor (TIGR02999 family)